ncbi:MAG: hypothetical protein ACC618_03310 [Patescibacteria group bacterium]
MSKEFGKVLHFYSASGEGSEGAPRVETPEDFLKYYKEERSALGTFLTDLRETVSRLEDLKERIDRKIKDFEQPED